MIVGLWPSTSSLPCHTQDTVAESPYRLVDFLLKWRHGQVTETEDELELMKEMAEQYSQFEEVPIMNSQGKVYRKEPCSKHTVVSSVRSRK
jgi:hypothetical protein